MIGFVARMIMFLSSVIVAWFVTYDYKNRVLMEMAVSFLLIILFLVVGAFWPYLVASFTARRTRALLRARFDAEELHAQIPQSKTRGNNGLTGVGSEKLRR